MFRYISEFVFLFALFFFELFLFSLFHCIVYFYISLFVTMQSIKFNLSSLPNSKEAAIVWAREHNLLRRNKNCSVHRKPMKLYQKSQHGIGRFRCLVGRGRCKDFSATVDSFFEDIRLPLDTAIK